MRIFKIVSHAGNVIECSPEAFVSGTLLEMIKSKRVSDALIANELIREGWEP
jgi:hypothetical protein